MRRKKTFLILCTALTVSLALCFSGCGRTPEPAPEPAADSSAMISDNDDAPVEPGKIWTFLDEDTANFAAGFDVSNMKCLRLDVIAESESIYNTTDPDLIEQVFRAMDKITVTGDPAKAAEHSDQIFTFIKNDGSEYSITFNDNNLAANGICFLLTGDEDLWDAVINLKENASESYTSDKDPADDGDVADGDPDDPENAKKKAGSTSHFSYEQESTGDGTEIIFGDALVLTLPPDWSGKYIMEKGDDYVTFYHKGSYESWKAYDGSAGGVLFGISYSETKEDMENADYVGLAKDGGYYYIHFTSDMQAFVEDENVKEEYFSLIEEVDSIANNAFSTISE